VRNASRDTILKLICDLRFEMEAQFLIGVNVHW
jgi:hypothetical protein